MRRFLHCNKSWSVSPDHALDQHVYSCGVAALSDGWWPVDMMHRRTVETSTAVEAGMGRLPLARSMHLRPLQVVLMRTVSVCTRPRDLHNTLPMASIMSGMFAV
eukprot:jgi/Ulvmu1/7424/UM036_0085.1